MKYYIVLPNGVVEIREDAYPLPPTGVRLSDADYDKLLSQKFIVSNGAIVPNPNPPKF